MALQTELPIRLHPIKWRLRTSTVINDMKDNFEFTNNWFETVPRPVWDQLIPQINPTRILEIGSYEGASTCYLISKLASQKEIEIHCIDTWGGGVEHKEVNMDLVEARFHHNTQHATKTAKHSVKLNIHKGFSDYVLCKLLTEKKKNYFDFIYVDGSHQAPDVLCDALIGFRLLRNQGVIVFDDYLWRESLPNDVDPIRCPKIAVDAFTNIYCRKIRILSAQLYQLYVQKISD